MIRVIDTASLPEETTKDALGFLADNLREADAAELRATTDADPAAALEASWRVSVRSWLILDRTGLPIGVFGVAAHAAAGLGVAWMMGTAGMEREAHGVARRTRRYVAEMHKLFPVLWNMIDARNELSIRWLEWAGFRMTDAHLTHGREGRLFYEYARTA